MSNQLTFLSPTKVMIPTSLVDDKLKDFLTFKDKAIEYTLKRALNTLKKVDKLKRFLPEEKTSEMEKNAKETIAYCQTNLHKSLLFNEDGVYYTYSGLVNSLSSFLGVEAVPLQGIPEKGFVPWQKEPTKQMRPYQKQALELLLETNHASVEIGTGLGKSFIIVNLIKRLGVKTVVVTPSVSIAYQLLEELSSAFGKRRVGQFFDGKKDATKLLTVAVAASLTKVEQGSNAWEELSSAKAVVVDESHTTPADTLQAVCFGCLANAAYRYFFSGTQMRNDGRDLVLEGIIGPIVFRMSVREGVDGGYLAKPVFRMVNVISPDDENGKDANDTTRKHLFYNENVNKAAARIADFAVKQKGHQVLILVEELEQFAYLLKYLTVPAKFAHGGITEKSKKSLPEKYHKSDPQKLVEEFNDGTLPVLVGTSCISTGTDIRANKTTIYLMGGISETKVRQAVGRNTRLTETKNKCYHFDFCVSNIELLARHAECRRAIYNDIYGPVETI